MNHECHRIITIHPFDPTGTKVGGIETHVRHTLKFAPSNVDMILVGIDESGTRELGKMIELESDTGEKYKFLPVMHSGTNDINKVAKNIFKSLTFNFFIAIIKHGKQIRALYKASDCSVEIQRYEFSWLCRMFAMNYVLLTHGDPKKEVKFDSLISKVWFINKFNEARAVNHANKIISVSSTQTERLQREFPHRRHDIEYMTVSVDDSLFLPTPYLIGDGVLRIMFAGRLDEFKRPQMMFNIIKSLSEKLDGKVEFHYVGASDPNKFEEYAAVKEKVVLHGFQRSPQIAELWKKMHMGMVTSTFEGWPVYVMEAVCSGRPVVSLLLEQMQNTFVAGQCGTMLDENSDDSTENMVNAILASWLKIKTGTMSPDYVNQGIADFKASNQMSRLYDMHMGLTS